MSIIDELNKAKKVFNDFKSNELLEKLKCNNLSNPNTLHKIEHYINLIDIVQKHYIKTGITLRQTEIPSRFYKIFGRSNWGVTYRTFLEIIDLEFHYKCNKCESIFTTTKLCQRVCDACRLKRTDHYSRKRRKGFKIGICNE